MQQFLLLNKHLRELVKCMGNEMDDRGVEEGRYDRITWWVVTKSDEGLSSCVPAAHVIVCSCFSHQRFTQDVVKIILRVHWIPDAWWSLICLEPNNGKKQTSLFLFLASSLPLPKKKHHMSKIPLIYPLLSKESSIRNKNYCKPNVCYFFGS